MKIKVIKIDYLSELQRPDRIKNDLRFYKSGRSIPLPAEFTSNTKVVMDEIPKLKLSDAEGDTYENAIKLHRALKNMDRTSASDQRLWAWLACEPFSEYMAARWAKGKSWTGEEELPKIRSVLVHWFLQRQSSKHYYNHGLAYLWWGVEMTKGSDTDPDPYVLTREFFSTQEYTRQLAGKLGRSRNFLRAILNFVVKNPKIFSGAKDEKIRKLVPKLNMVAAYRLLPFLDDEELEIIIADLAKNL